MGWGLDVHWAARRARARLADRRSSTPRPIGHTLRPARQRLRARRGRWPRRARSSPSGPYVRRDEVRDAGGRTGEGRGRQRVLPARRTTRCSASGRTARRSPRATPGADVRVLVLHRPVPPRSTRLRDAPRRPAHAGRAAAARDARRPRRALRAVPRPAALAHATGRGARGRRRRSPARCARLRAALPLRPRPRPQRRARRPTRCCARALGAPLVVSVHGGDVYFTAPRYAGRRARPCAARSARARLVLANSAGIEDAARRARRARTRASCTSAPTSPSTPPHKAADPDARHRRAPRRAQAPRRRRARAVAAARPPPAAALPRRRRRPRARAAGARSPRELGVADRVELAGQLAARGGAGAARARRTCSSCPASTRPSASPTSRRWPAGCRRSARAARPGPQEIAAAGDGLRLVPPGDVEALAARARRAARRARATCASSARRARATVVRRLHLGALRARDGRRPTRTRCGERAAGPLRHQPRPARPRRRVPRAARARAARARALRRALASRHGRARRPRRAASAASTSARSTRSPRAGATRAVVCGTAGRVALPAAFLGAQRARVPFVLWSALWGTCARPRTSPRARCCAASTAARRSSSPTGRTSPRTPGGTARARSPSRPQAVDNAFWATPVAADAAARRSRRCSSGATCPRRALGGAARGVAARRARRRRRLARRSAPTRVGRRPEQVRNFYAAADVLVIPSLATRHFLEPWGLVANEAMNQHLPVIATDAVGAAAGGLVRHERNGLVVPAGDRDALAAALRTPARRPRAARAAGRQRRRATWPPYTHDAWADGFAGALRGATGRAVPC